MTVFVVLFLLEGLTFVVVYFWRTNSRETRKKVSKIGDKVGLICPLQDVLKLSNLGAGAAARQDIDLCALTKLDDHRLLLCTLKPDPEVVRLEIRYGSGKVVSDLKNHCWYVVCCGDKLEATLVRDNNKRLTGLCI